MGTFVHPCEGDMIVKSTNEKARPAVALPPHGRREARPVLRTHTTLTSDPYPPQIPYFNAPIYLENKSDVGKVDEIFGTITECYFSVKVASGIAATSFKPGDKLFINPLKLLPLERFLSQPKGAGGGGGKGGKGGKGKGGGGKGKGGKGGKGKGKGMKGGRGSPGGRGKGGRG